MKTQMLAAFMLSFASVAWSAESRWREDLLARLQTADHGRAAFGRPTIVDEMQIIGEVRKLTPEEAKTIGEIFAAGDTWHQRQPDGSVRALLGFEYPLWNFKFVLGGPSGLIAWIRLDTSSGQGWLIVDGETLRVPTIQPEAMAKIRKVLDAWFPGWAETTAQNKREWERNRREQRL